MAIEPVIKRSRRARRIRIAIQRGRVVLTIPTRVPLSVGMKFFESKRDWVEGMLVQVQLENKAAWTGTTREYHSYQARAKKVIVERVKYWAQLYGFSYTSVSIKNQRSKWGSCSRAGALNFNYRLFFLPLDLVDYIVVHELCHLRHMNHSRAFWTAVMKILPGTPKFRNELRKYHL